MEDFRTGIYAEGRRMRKNSSYVERRYFFDCSSNLKDRVHRYYLFLSLLLLFSSLVLTWTQVNSREMKLIISSRVVFFSLSQFDFHQVARPFFLVHFFETSCSSKSRRAASFDCSILRIRWKSSEIEWSVRWGCKARWRQEKRRRDERRRGERWAESDFTRGQRSMVMHLVCLFRFH